MAHQPNYEYVPLLEWHQQTKAKALEQEFSACNFVENNSYVKWPVVEQ